MQNTIVALATAISAVTCHRAYAGGGLAWADRPLGGRYVLVGGRNEQRTRHHDTLLVAIAFLRSHVRVKKKKIGRQ